MTVRAGDVGWREDVFRAMYQGPVLVFDRQGNTLGVVKRGDRTKYLVDGHPLSYDDLWKQLWEWDKAVDPRYQPVKISKHWWGDYTETKVVYVYAPDLDTAKVFAKPLYPGWKVEP